MSVRDVVWPHFRAENILHEDDDLLVVHKPAGVPSQTADEEHPDDLVLRVKTFLALRDGRSNVYLGVHQRLDRDTSGVVLFTKRASANASIAKQFEKRFVKKRYLAAVTGWPRERRTATLVDDLGKGEDGRMEVVRRGQRAVTHVVAKTRRGERTLLELVLETGRTHQARVQLAHARAPIAGDPLYRGADAPRLMLHAASIELEHPTTRKKLVVRDGGTNQIDTWVEKGSLGANVYDDREALDGALGLATERRWGLGRADDTTAFRLVNEEGDALPGLAVDVYGDHLVAQIYVGGIWEDEKRRERVLDRLAALGFAGVYLKLRPKQANVLVDTRRDDLAPPAAVRGASTPSGEIEVRENGVPFLVRLGDGLSTGIFLDQRRNRKLVRLNARGKSVANLFAYTCAFSVVAAAGGATRTVSVDASVTALERGRAAFAHAGLSLAEHAFVAEDAFAWLARMAKKKERFDLVILDPPSYSSTKKRRFVAESDYDELVAMAASITAPGGQILACCNHRGMVRAKLRRLVHEGLRAAGREPVQVKDLPAGSDYPPEPGREPHLKSLLVTIR